MYCCFVLQSSEKKNAKETEREKKKGLDETNAVFILSIVVLKNNCLRLQWSNVYRLIFLIQTSRRYSLCEL